VEISLAATNYLGVTGTNAEARDGLFTQNQQVRLLDVLDGTSNTLMVGERGFRKGALEVIDTSEDIDNLRFGNWFSAVGQRNGSVGVVLGSREINFGSGDRRLNWERDCPIGPYHFQPQRQTRDVTGAIREECDLFQYWSYHHGGTHFLFADGSVHFLSYNADPILPLLATRAGGEVVTLP
jgi:prepilin-type processing-associated H-X9-DG protein